MPGPPARPSRRRRRRAVAVDPARQTLAAVAGDAAKVNLVACVRTPCIHVVLYSLPYLVLVVVHSFVTVQQLCSQSMCVRFGNELEYDLELTPHSRPAVPFRDRARRKREGIKRPASCC